MKTKLMMGLAGAVSLAMAQNAMASCADVDWQRLKDAATTAATKITGGYQAPAGLNMWVTMVDETGKVCDVVTTGQTGAQAGNSAWLGSRVISAQKANTANAFSLDGYAISTANLYRTQMPGHDLYGLQFSNPVDTSKAYGGGPETYGTDADFLKNKRIGGVNVFGGGLALYKDGKKIGAIGVSGDTACRDHAFAWRVRADLDMHPFENGGNLGGISGIIGGLDDFGTGITTYNIDKNGNVQAAGAIVAPISGAKYGDELILESGHDNYWNNTWSHPVCVGSILNIQPDLPVGDPSQNVDIPANGIIHAP